MLHSPATITILSHIKTGIKFQPALEMVNNDPFTRLSPSFDILFDSPIEVGNQDVFGFDVGRSL
jgi:predicted metalloprotease with PDZ domain